MVRDYAQILNDKVVNVLVLDEGESLDAWGDLIPLDDYNEGRWGIGWYWNGTKPIKPIPAPNLTVEGVPSADGTKSAKATATWEEHPYRPIPTTVVFTLNGLDSNPVNVVNKSASLDFTASGSGPIDVTLGNVTVRVDVP